MKSEAGDESETDGFVARQIETIKKTPSMKHCLPLKLPTSDFSLDSRRWPQTSALSPKPFFIN